MHVHALMLMTIQINIYWCFFHIKGQTSMVQTSWSLLALEICTAAMKVSKHALNKQIIEPKSD